jgi:NAD(P)-dependent dehydrogenase (short-subunit alcohol dehydrogenase family)
MNPTPPNSSRGARVALITGAAQRIGRAMALHLASHGWRVAVHYRHSAAQAAQTVADICAHAGAGAAQAFAADLADESACEALPDAVVAAMGRLDAVVNNASLFDYDTIHSFTTLNLDRHWRANTAPALILARALHRLLAPGATGVVVNLLDQKLSNPNPDHLSYTLSKAALQAATTVLAQALAPRVRVCGLAPGVTLLSGDMTTQEFADAHQMTPLGRSSTAEDLAHAVRFLLDSPAITGTTLVVDGGQHLQAQPRDVLFLARDTAAQKAP